MFATQNLSLIKTTDAAPGTLLLQGVGAPGALALIASVHDQGQDVRSCVELDNAAEWPARLRPAVTNEGMWIAIDNWQLRVDPASSYTSFQTNPAAGDAFLFGGEAGIVARFVHTVGYVTKDGVHHHQLDWQLFAGFRRWQIVHWPEGGADMVVLFERNPPGA